jgi:hypothetical protein
MMGYYTKFGKIKIFHHNKGMVYVQNRITE